MKIVLDVKNASSLKEPRKDQIIIYDGKQWYVTTRQILFEEYEEKIDSKLHELEEKALALEADNKEFKNSVSKDIIKMSEVVEGILLANGKAN